MSLLFVVTDAGRWQGVGAVSLIAGSPFDVVNHSVATVKKIPASMQQVHQQRIPALDGIRGLAILLVLLYHFTGVGLHNKVSPLLVVGSQWGWIGVDLFFVLSGYLITGILFDAKGSDGYFRNFYARRAVRIFPAYYLLLALVFILSPYIGTWQGEWTNQPVFGPHWIYWTYLSNFYNGYWAHSEGLLGHTWSLAIEEQFYLIWPALILLYDRRKMLRICGIIAAMALALRSIMLVHGSSIYSVLFLTFTRMDALAIGAAIALLIRGPDGTRLVNSLARKLIVLAPLMLGLIYAGKKSHLGFFNLCDEISKYTLIAIFFGALLSIVVTSPPRAMINRIFSSRPMTFFGHYSYGIYLFHLPMVMLISQKFPQPQTAGGQFLRYMIFLAGTIILGLLSWHLWEKQFLKLKRFFPMAHHIVPADRIESVPDVGTEPHHACDDDLAVHAAR